MERFWPDITRAHPPRVKAMAWGRIKPDKSEATILAQLLRADWIPAPYMPPPEIGHWRQWLRTRVSLVSWPTTITCGIQAVPDKSGPSHGYAELFGTRGRAGLKAVELEPIYRQAVEGYLAVLLTIRAPIEAINAVRRHQMTVTPEAQRLTTIPGLRVVGALRMLSEMGDIHRFPSGEHWGSDAGRLPSVSSSGGKTRHGRLTQQGATSRRGILVEAAIPVARKEQRVAARHRPVAAKHGTPSAGIAVARPLLRGIYALRTKGEEVRFIPVDSPKSSGERRGVVPPSPPGGGVTASTLSAPPEDRSSLVPWPEHEEGTERVSSWGCGHDRLRTRMMTMLTRRMSDST